MVYRLIIALFVLQLCISGCAVKSPRVERTLIIYDLDNTEYILSVKYSDASEFKNPHGPGFKYTIPAEVKRMKIEVEGNKYSVKFRKKYVSIGRPFLGDSNKVFIYQTDTLSPSW